MLSQRIPASVVSFNAAIGAAAEGFAWWTALFLVADLQRCALQPTLPSFCAAMTACARAEAWEEALQTFHALSWHGLRPDAVALGAAISACDRGTQWQGALHLFAGASTVLTDAIAATAAISACAQADKWQAAQQLWVEMHRAGVPPTVTTCDAMAAAYSRSHRWQQVLALQAEMHEASLQPSPGMLAILAKGFGASFHWAKALNLLAERCEAPVRGAVAAECARSTMWAYSLASMVAMRQKQAPLDSVAFGILTGACAKSQQLARAVPLLSPGGLEASGALAAFLGQATRARAFGWRSAGDLTELVGTSEWRQRRKDEDPVASDESRAYLEEPA
ncbi:PTAC2 [Symbiodinium natans]|uniref:PTAC2 protein n=1 Tax=Symbiodinium natans TaxID=878477 RepID=A0A812LWK6_9DINO|nr:PTAC2 [Symbiodinium natans]